MQNKEIMSLDELLSQRRSIREFGTAPLPKETIEAVIEAGRLAPFAGLVQKHTNIFRHFFVIHKDSDAAKKLVALCEDGRRQEVVRIKAEGLDKKYPEVASLIGTLSTKPANDVFLSPWLVVVAERGGLPQREEVCLGYVMENMWLKATELGLAFKVCSAVSDIHDTDGLKALLGLEPSEIYAFDAVSLGYPKREIPARTQHEKPEKSITYFE